MAVHAHPDDEAISTGGVLARYAAEGVRTVLVTCTNGDLGDPGHDEGQVVALRRAELEESCRVLGVTHLELLGYHDSGMMGWPDNDAPHAFWQAEVDEAAAALAALIEQHRPQVVITYDERGFYGHPDHIQANRITLAAVEATGIPEKLYYPAVPRGAMEELATVLAERGIEFPLSGEDLDFLAPDEAITTVVDVSETTGAKFDSLAAHASQSENIFFLALGRELFGDIFRREAFIRVQDRTGAPVPETDLFAGLR
jgi:LmbE family N-acetylglucosaminyl deacetylase